MDFGMQLKTVFLLTAMTAILWGVGWALGGPEISILFLFFAFAINFFAYWFSDKFVLATTRAKQVTEAEAPELHSIIDELVAKAGMPKPKVYLIDQDSPNAFATGRNPQHAAVAATRGILRIMDRGELAGVMAHELSHVRHRDTAVMTVVASIAGAISWLAMMAMWSFMFGGFRRQSPYAMLIMLGVMVLAPIAATIVQLAISRAREFGADAGAARTFGKPLELASALEKLSIAVKQRPMEKVNAAYSHLFIVNPLGGGNVMNKLFTTHPAVEERVRRLREMAYAV